jgi:tetratricopeptide (TPR) repeat protein
MQTEYIAKRQVKVPEKAPAALGSLLVKTQEGLEQGGGLDAVRWLHDSLAFLTEFFASFAVGALNTVGPYSSAVQKLLEQPPSLDRSERLLSQAFVDWKAHPHHPAYESLRDSFYLTSRLQSSRFAPRRHTRWLGVEGRAVAGLERLTRWSRRIDLLVNAKDEDGAKSFVHIYTPILWIWTDAVSEFFDSWTVNVVTEVKDGMLGLVGSASSRDVRLDLVPVERIAGLKCRYESDGNGGVSLSGFLSGLGASSPTSVEPVPPPSARPVGPATETSSGEDLQLVFDPATGNFVPKSDLLEKDAEASVEAGAPETPLVSTTDDGSTDFESGKELGAARTPTDLDEVPSPDELDEIPSPEGLDEVPSPDELDEIPSPDGLDEVPSPDELDEISSPDGLDEVPSPDELDEIPSPDGLDEVPSPDELDEIPSPDGLDEVPSPAELDEVTTPADLSTPDSLPSGREEAEEFHIPLPDLNLSGGPSPLPDFSAPPAPPSFSSPTEEATPPPEGRSTKEVTSDATVESSESITEVPEAPDFAAGRDLVEAEETNFPLSTTDSTQRTDIGPLDDSTLPDLSVPPVPPLSAGDPSAPPEIPELGASTREPESDTSPEVSHVSAPSEIPDFSAPPEAPDVSEAPDFSAPPEEPDVSAPAGLPDFSAPPEAPDVSEAPDFSDPPEEPDVSAPAGLPDFSAPPEAPDVSEAPDFSAPPEEPDVSAPAGLPDFSAPPEAPDVSEAPDFSAPPEEPDVSAPAGLPDFSAPPEAPDVSEAPDFSAPPEETDVNAPTDVSVPAEAADISAPPEVPDFSRPTESPDFSAPPEIPDVSAPANAPEFNEAIEPTQEILKPVETPRLDIGSPARSTDEDASGFAPPALPDFPASKTPDAPLFTPPASAVPGVPAFKPPTADDSQEGVAPTVEVPIDSLGVSVDETSSPSIEQTVEVDSAAELQPEELKSVEIETPAANREIGFAAEEILEDDYKFSAEDGPARPHWTGWSVDQRELVQAVCEQLVAQRKAQAAESFVSPLKGALGGQSAKVQVLMEPACGKTRLSEYLADSYAEAASPVPLLASWESSSSERLPGQILLDFFSQLRGSKQKLNVQVVLPEPETISALAISADQGGFSKAFRRLIGQLSALNRKPLLLILDQPPAAVREALAMTPPDGIRIVSFINSSLADDKIGMIVDLGRRWKAASAELYGESARAFFDHEDGSLLRIALATEMEKEGLTLDDSLALAEEAALELDALHRPLLAALSLERTPVSLDDMDQWFLDPKDVVSCLKAFPSVFDLATTRLSPIIGLAHPSIHNLVVTKLDEERALVARKLLGWVVAQLERTAPDRYGGLQVREIVFRNFLRLYKFSRASRDPAIIEWVIRNKELQRRRIALTEHLEKPGSRYDLHELLSLLAELLDELVESGNCDDLRDELGWARSNLALNQLKLGLLPQAKEDIDRATALFEKLVKKDRQYEFRPALSTTYYRASRICEAASETEDALEYAKQAVQGFVDLVEDRGRTELAPRLGLALAHRGGLYYQADDLAAAKGDLQRASQLLESADGGQGANDSIRTIVEIELELAAIFTKEGDHQNAIQVSGKAVQLATEAVEEKGLDEFQPLLATCHAVRAKAYFKMAENDRAVRDVTKSISLRNLSVDEGRLEQRYHLAKDLQLKAQIDQARGALEDASRGLKQAVELLETLSREGRSDAAPQLLRCLQERAKINLATGDSEAGTQDLKRALSLLEGSAEPDPGLKLSIMETMLRAYIQSGNTREALSISQTLLANYHQAQAWESYGNIQLIRGDALEKSGDMKGALTAYNQAASLIGQLLAQGQTDELLTKVSKAYLGVGIIEYKMGHPAKSVPQLKQAIDVLLHLFQQRGKYGVLPKLLTAYSLFSAGNTAVNRFAEAKQALQSGFDVLGYMETHGGQGGVPTAQGLEHEKGELHRQRANLLLAEGDPNNALNDAEEAIRNFLATRQQNQRGTWKDEMARTWILKSRILFALKDFAQADKSIQEAISHFEERVREGQYAHFSDMMRAFSVRADHAGKSGKIDLVLEEYNRMLSITTSAAQSGAEIDHEVEMAKIFERRALVYQQQNLLNEAYADYESVIGLYLNQVSAKGRTELASELVRTYLARGKMTTRAGHGQHAISDFSEAVNVAKALVTQGQVAAVPDLATALHERAEVFRGLGRGAEALQDLQGCVGFRMQLIQTNPEPALMGELGRALLLQGTLLVAAGQLAQAASSLDQANSFFTNLVETQGRQEFSGELAQSLIQRVSLSSDKRDPALREVLVKAVNLVNQQAQEGKPVGRDFAIECLKTVVELLQQEDFNAIGSLIDSVLDLVETVVTDNRADQDFVKLTDLLLAASAGLIDDRRTARRPHFLSLACVSCNREIQMFGTNSLPRLVYCLYELGQALERSKPPAVLNYIGSSFALLGELAGQQQANEDFMRELKMMISTWRSLPPQIPALANVSRHMLSQLLRLT